MLDQLHADDAGVGVDGHHGVDRLAGIAGGPHEIRGDEGPADGFTALEHGNRGQIVTDRPEPFGAGDEGCGLDPGQQLDQRGFGAGRQGAEQDEHEKQQQTGRRHRSNPVVPCRSSHEATVIILEVNQLLRKTVGLINVMIFGLFSPIFRRLRCNSVDKLGSAPNHDAFYLIIIINRAAQNIPLSD